MVSYLNLGCGARLHTEWTNVDFVAGAPGVIAHDLRRGIPFATDTFDAVYHSHVLEHFPREGARAFLSECRRVLRPGGIIRVVVPDLESLVKTYLRALERAASGDERWAHNYEYVMLELFDQSVRERPGGELADYLQRDEIPNIDFVIEQGGVDAQGIIDAARRRNVSRAEVDARARPLTATARRALRSLRRAGFGREVLLRLALGADYEALRVGRFRRRGEPHLWMYDRHSLVKLLKETGFGAPRLCGAAESQIPDWPRFNLDTEPDGTIYKPHSLYAEARK